MAYTLMKRERGLYFIVITGFVLSRKAFRVDTKFIWKCFHIIKL